MSGAGVHRLQVAVGGGVSVAVSDYRPAAVEHTVVFIHGFCLNRGAWVDQGRRVMARYPGRVRVIRFDLRGHGQSSAAPMDTYTIDHCAGDLAELLDVLSVDGPMTIVGHSMGGMIALSYLSRLAQDRPVDPTGLVLIATAAGHLTRCGMGRLLDSPATDAVFDMVRHSPAHVLAAPLGAIVRQMSIAGRRSPGWAAVAAVAASALSSTPVTTAVGFLPSLRRFDQYSILESICAQVAVISGGADVLTPPQLAQDLADRIPGCRHVCAPAAGHMIVQQAPELVADAIAAIIAAGCPQSRRSAQQSSGLAAAR